MPKDDLFYIERVLKGDKNAFRFLVDKYKSMALTIAYRVVKSESTAEDIAQQAFIKAYSNLHSFSKTSKFSNWLYRIVYNTSITYIRNTKKLHENYEENINQLDLTEDHNYDHEENKKQIVQNAIDKLPQDEATIITLYYFDEISVKEVAEIVNISESNVKIKLFRARKKLEEFLQKKREELYI